MNPKLGHVTIEPAEGVPGLFDCRCTVCGEAPRDLTLGQTRSFEAQHRHDSDEPHSHD